MRYHLSQKAISDIAGLLDESEENFGLSAQARYAALIDQAIRDVVDDPFRPRSQARPDIAADVRIWHLRNSRDRVRGDKVKRPRHFLMYRVVDEQVQIGRVMFERRDLPGQVVDDMWK